MRLPDGMQAAVFTDPSNLFYLTGYSNSDAAVVIIRDKAYYVTDKRCLSEAGRVLKGFETVDSDGERELYRSGVVLSEGGQWRLSVRPLGVDDNFCGLGLICEEHDGTR